MRFDVDVVVIGAGAAGLFAAAEAAEAGARTLVLEKNPRPGVKILASGGSKCNVTSTLPPRELGLWFGVRGERFLRHGLLAFGPTAVRELLTREGVATEELPFEKVFPRGGRAVDVLRAFLRRLERSGAELALGEGVLEIAREDGGGFRVRTPRRALRARRVVAAAGGASYPKTGCTGDGYAWCASLGHTIVTPRPALVPLLVSLEWVRDLTGIAAPDAVVHAHDANGKRVFSRARPVLFTHRGLSGPGPMDASRYLNPDPSRLGHLVIDWLPTATEEGLSAELERPGGDRVIGRLPETMPRRLREALLGAAGVPLDRRASELRRPERLALIEALKRARIPVTGDEGFPKAEVTAGGVALDEIDPKTMESRLAPGFHVAGELLDLDGPIGGFNFQSAFSTGTLAGRAVAAAIAEIGRDPE
ncbi:MAG: aminoacetone oxidase family FAD-binding enzyme [Planctomycetota bacterium]